MIQMAVLRILTTGREQESEDDVMKTTELYAGIIKEPVKPLVPHEAAPQIEVLGKEVKIPTILLSLDAYCNTYYITKASGTDEVGWLGTVQKLEDRRYLIDKVFLFNQQVIGAHCEFDQNDIGKFYNEMLKKDPANKLLLNSILFWGHLHPGEMTEPSSQDEEQMELFAHNPFFIRGIFTRVGKCVFTFFDYQRGIKIIDCPWQLRLEDSERQDAIAREMGEKVKRSFFSKEGLYDVFSKGGLYGGRKSRD